MKQPRPVKILYEFTITKRMNIKLAKTIPISQANFFCGAPTYSGTCLLTIRRPSISEGENLGLTNMRMIKSVRNMVTKYFRIKKFPSKWTSMIEQKRTKKQKRLI